MHCIGHATGLHLKHLANGNIVATRILLAALSMILPSLVCGCSERQVKMLGPNDISRSDVISKEELREALRDFEAFFTATFRQATNELDDGLSAKNSRKINLLKRGNTRYSIVFREDRPARTSSDIFIFYNSNYQNVSLIL